MTLQDLIDELRQNLLRDKSDAVGGAIDQLWSTASLIRYLDDGYQKFASHTLLIRDAATPAVTQVTLSQGVSTYALDPRVLSVLSARVGNSRWELKQVSHDVPQGMLISSGGPPVKFELLADAEPSMFWTGETAQSITVYPAPSSEFDGVTMYLRVARLPLNPLANNPTSLAAQLEMPNKYHLDIAEWAAYRALRNHDVDGENMSKAERHKIRFDEAVEEARNDIRRQTATPIVVKFNSRF